MGMNFSVPRELEISMKSAENHQGNVLAPSVQFLPKFEFTFSSVESFLFGLRCNKILIIGAVLCL